MMPNDDMVPPPPQPAAPPPRFALNPVPASVLAANEARRLDAAARLGRLRTGCGGVDDHVLLGGLERGCVVGLSAEEEDGFGVPFGLQILARNLVSGALGRALLVTPKPLGTILPALESSIRACVAAAASDETQQRQQQQQQQQKKTVGEKETEREVEEKARALLDRVMISCVFDVDGLWEVLAELDRPVAIPDSQSESDDDDDDDCGEGKEEIPGGGGGAGAGGGKPEMVLVTHFSSLLSGLFAQRPHAAAHEFQGRLAAHARHLSRGMASHPTILLLNSTTTSSSSSTGQTGRGPGGGDGGMIGREKRAADPTLRSVFAPPPPSSAQGYHGRHNEASDGDGGGGGRTAAATATAAAGVIRPSFGLVFAQALDLHILCTKIPRTRADADALFNSNNGGGGLGGEAAAGVAGGGGGGGVEYVTAVEVLLDVGGVWEGRTGAGRRSREQRWSAVTRRMVPAGGGSSGSGGMFRDAFGDGHGRAGGGGDVGEVRLAAGFGGPRV